MNKLLLVLGTALLLVGISPHNYAETPDGHLLEVKTKTFDGEIFNFPADLQGNPVTVLMLAISDSKEQGERQQQELLAWQAAIDASGGLPSGILVYHFPVLKDSFFLPSGIIRNAMADSYKDKVAPAQSGVLFIKNLDEFLASAGISMDDQATVVIVDGQANVLAQIKGTVTDEKLAALRSALKS